jgi:hypothetical protein
MDIFTSANRGKDDSIKKPLNYPETAMTEKKLKDDYDRETQLFQIYLKNLYAKFDYKINKCNYSCISKANNYAEARECESNCAEGVTKFGSYIDSRVSEMQELLGQCVANAASLPNAMDEIYYCYEKYNKGFGKLKEFITEESMYYE